MNRRSYFIFNSIWFPYEETNEIKRQTKDFEFFQRRAIFYLLKQWAMEFKNDKIRHLHSDAGVVKKFRGQKFYRPALFVVARNKIERTLFVFILIRFVDSEERMNRRMRYKRGRRKYGRRRSNVIALRRCKGFLLLFTYTYLHCSWILTSLKKYATHLNK